MNRSWWTKIASIIYEIQKSWFWKKVNNWWWSVFVLLFCLSICTGEQSNETAIVSMFMSILNPYVSTMLCHWKPLKSIKWRSQPFVWTFICIRGEEHRNKKWNMMVICSSSPPFFVVVTNFEALCFHRNLPRRDDEVCYSPAGFFSSKMKTNWRLFSFPIPPEKAAMNSFVSGIH